MTLLKELAVVDSNRLNRWLTLGANAAVLIGIVLVLVELHQTQEITKAQIRNELSSELVQFASMVGSDSELTSLVRRGDAGDALSPDESAQYTFLMIANLRLWENIHYQYRRGMFDQGEFEAERRAWRLSVNRSEGFAEFWCESRSYVSPRFAEELDDLFEEDRCDASTD